MEPLKDQTLLESYIRRYKIRQHFPDEVMTDLSLYHADSGDVICEQGESLTHLYLLVKGKATVSYIAENGKKLIVSFKQAFELFGDIEFVRKVYALHMVEAAGEVHLIGIPFHSLHTYAVSYPPFLQLLLGEVAEKFQLKSRAFSFSLTHGASTRLASYMVRTMTAADGSRLNGPLPTSRTSDLADHIGTTSRHVNRLLSALTQQDIIERSEGTILIKNWTKLEELANQSFYA